MSLWRRAPREVYRVYGEDQYLEGETAPEEETAAEDTTTVESDNSRVASWATFTADGPPASAGTGGLTVPKGGSHAGRLLGVGLLVGIGLATLALVFLNMSHRHGAAPGLLRPGTRVTAEQGVGHGIVVGPTRVIAHSASSRPGRAPRFSDPPARTSSVRAPGSTPRHRASADGRSDTPPRLERARSAALRAFADVAPTTVAVEPPAGVVVESPAQDEFGFEQ